MVAVDANDGRSGRYRSGGKGIRDRGEGHRGGDGEQVADVVGRLSVTSRSTNRDLISRLDGLGPLGAGPTMGFGSGLRAKPGRQCPTTHPRTTCAGCMCVETAVLHRHGRVGASQSHQMAGRF